MAFPWAQLVKSELIPLKINGVCLFKFFVVATLTTTTAAAVAAVHFVYVILSSFFLCFWLLLWLWTISFFSFGLFFVLFRVRKREHICIKIRHGNWLFCAASAAARAAAPAVPALADSQLFKWKRRTESCFKWIFYWVYTIANEALVCLSSIHTVVM